MKKLRLLLFSVILFFVFSLNCYASSNTFTRTKENLLIPSDVIADESNINTILNTPAVDSREKIYDFAEILTDEQEKKIYDEIKKYIKNSSFDSVIVTTKNLNGFQINDYAYNFYDFNDFNNEGIVFVICVTDGEPEIFMGNSGPKTSALFTVYTDERINKTLAYVYGDIKKGEYNSGVEKYLSVVQGFYDLEYPSDDPNTKKESDEKVIPWIEIVVLSVALSFIVIVILLNILRKKNKVESIVSLDDNLDKTTLSVRCESDELVDTSLSHSK